MILPRQKMMKQKKTEASRVKKVLFSFHSFFQGQKKKNLNKISLAEELKFAIRSNQGFKVLEFFQTNDISTKSKFFTENNFLHYAVEKKASIKVIEKILTSQINPLMKNTENKKASELAEDGSEVKVLLEEAEKEEELTQILSYLNLD